jgi:hypothetical protein
MKYRIFAIFAIFLMSSLVITINSVLIRADTSDSKIIHISSNTDDCLRFWNGSSWVWQHNSTYHTVGHQTETATKHGLGLRFINIPIPNNANITEAHLTIVSRSNTGNMAVRSRIYGENADDAATFNTKADFETRLKNITKATVSWDNIPTWDMDAEYTSPDIKAVLQEIVKRSSWKNGNSIAIFWEDFEGRSDSNRDNVDRRSYSYDVNPVKSIRLYIAWTIKSTAIPTNVAGSTSPDQSSLGVKSTTLSDHIPTIVAVTLAILLVVGLIYLLIRKYRKRDELFDSVCNAIRKYVPPKYSSIEIAYQWAIYEYLKKEFHSIKIEPPTETRDRIDIVIGHIGIEIKGPTKNKDLETLLIKCMKYGKYYRKLIFVLFAPEYQQSKFEQIKAEIRTKYPEITTKFIPISIHK